MNYAENLLAYAFKEPNSVAILFSNELGEETEITWQQLCDKVSLVQQWLNNLGSDLVMWLQVTYLICPKPL